MAINLFRPKEISSESENQTPEIEIPGINPDRVKTNEEISENKTKSGKVTWEEIRHNFHFPTLEIEASFRASALRLIAAGTLIGTIMTNIDNELIKGKQEDSINKKSVKEALDTKDMQSLVRETQEELCKISNIELIHRFILKDENGNESFNPGAIIVPLAVSIGKDCEAKVEVELHFPYHLARKFTEIVSKNPEARDEVVKKMAEFITSEVQNQLVIKGIAGVTNTAYAYNRETNEILAGTKQIVDLGKFEVSNMKFEGTASAEAEKSDFNMGDASLHGFNPENVELAGKRLEDLKPLILEAFKEAGVDEKAFKNIKEFKYEHNLIDGEIKELAKISTEILGGVVTGSDEEIAYALIQEINNGNPNVIKKLESNPGYLETVNSHIFKNRGINVSFEAETETNKKTVYNMVFMLPLMLLIPSVRIRKGTGIDFSIKDFKLGYESAEYETIKKRSPEARRLFSEKIPTKLDKERSFDETYESVNLSEKSQNTHNLLQHMLVEEVYPSLDEGTKEPMIDYEKIVNDCRQYLFSDTREGGIKKGSYKTPEDAKKKITEELLEMWEKHDVATYPMKGIDLKNVLNYRNNEDIVYWAKTLAEFLTNLAEKTEDEADFRVVLIEKIQDAFNSRAEQRGADRNIFVKSML